MKAELSEGLQDKMYQKAEKFLLRYVSELKTTLLNVGESSAPLREKKKRDILANMVGKISLTKNQKQTFKSEILDITEKEREKINELFKMEDAAQLEIIQNSLMKRRDRLYEEAIGISNKDRYILLTGMISGIDDEGFTKTVDSLHREKLKKEFKAGFKDEEAYLVWRKTQPEEYLERMNGVYDEDE